MELLDHVTTKAEANLEQNGFKAASAYLRHIGYEILETESITPHGLIDMIARTPDDEIAFITLYCAYGHLPEVRTITQKSRRSLETRAIDWLDDHRCYANCSLTFDVVYASIFAENTRAVIRHVRNVLSVPLDDDGRPIGDDGMTVKPLPDAQTVKSDTPIRAEDVDDPDGQLLPDIEEVLQVEAAANEDDSDD